MPDTERLYTFADLIHEGAMQSPTSTTEIPIVGEQGAICTLRVPRNPLLPSVVAHVKSFDS